LRKLSRWCRARPALAATVCGLSIFYLIHLFTMLVLKMPGEGGEFHHFVTLLVIIWSVGAGAFSYLSTRRGWERVAPYGWTMMESLLVTLFLLAAKGPSSPVVIYYLLLVAGSALRFQIPLVWMACVLSVLGYGLLHLDALFWRQEMRTPPHTPFYFVLALVILAGIMHLLLRRLRALPGSASGSTVAGHRSAFSANRRASSEAAR
jgi:hypothetical protein